MFSLFSKNKSRKKSAAHLMAEDEIAYAIGDVHGCYDSLLNLLEKLESDRAARPQSKATIVFLGDLVDRGPASREVLEFLAAYQPGWADLIFLKGNHEEVMLSVMKGNLDAMRSWFSFGGKSCARSYGVDNFGHLEMNPQKIMRSLQRRVPQSHIDFLETFQDYHIIGDYLFVHAGIKPKVAIKDQSARDMRWIREKFLAYKKPHPMMVVHGHTVVDNGPEYHSNRIALDTGAHKGRPLTAACFVASDVAFIMSEPLGT